MGLSIISSLPKGISSATSSLSATPSGSLSGQFADLLSGELLNLIGLVPEQPGQTISTKTLEQRSSLPNEEARGDDATLFDPSLVITYLGNPALQAETTTPRAALGIQPPTETTEARIAEFSTGTLERASTLPEQTRAKSSAPEVLNAFDKLGLAPPSPEQKNTRTTPAESQRPFEISSSAAIGLGPAGRPDSIQAANIAAETNLSETNSSTLTSTLGANTNPKQLGEAIAAEPSSINTHLREASWPQHFGEKIIWLTKTDQQTAQININPRELGPVQITLNLNGDQAKITFSSPHPEVRQAIENALPQLKDMLSSSGINLGQANVGANLAQHNPENPYQPANGKRLADENAILPANDIALSTSSTSTLQRGRGLVDLFA